MNRSLAIPLGELYRRFAPTLVNQAVNRRQPFTRPAELRRPGFPLAGCLVRIAGLVFLLIAAALIFLFLLFGGFIVN